MDLMIWEGFSNLNDSMGKNITCVHVRRQIHSHERMILKLGEEGIHSSAGTDLQGELGQVTPHPAAFPSDKWR